MMYSLFILSLMKFNADLLFPGSFHKPEILPFLLVRSALDISLKNEELLLPVVIIPNKASSSGYLYGYKCWYGLYRTTSLTFIFFKLEKSWSLAVMSLGGNGTGIFRTVMAWFKASINGSTPYLSDNSFAC